jgi:circadian clock protein KaiC
MKKEIEKINSGIPGLNEILRGGIKKNSSILITGSPGTGKSIFAMQFIIEGAKNNEPGLFITSEETIEVVREHTKTFDFNLEELEKKGLVIIVQQQITTKKLVSISTPLDIIKKRKIKRVALDSLTLFEYFHVAGEIDYRKEVLEFIWKMKEAGVTLVATSEKRITDIDKLVFDQEDFLFEGLILLTKIRKSSSFERCLHVVKLRGQDHLINIYPFSITNKGIKVYPNQIPFSLVEKDVERKKF